ncbi:MAG: hypothetical protein WAT91_09450 [Saprospiraceae bacterium]
MKWILGLLIGISIFSACSNELVVVDKWKNIPVVWGLLSKSDTAHYIRVEKAFLDPTTSAYVIAQIPDSLYYKNVTVTLKRINNGQVFTLQRVDGNLEGYPRDTFRTSNPDSAGIFAVKPNYLYKIKENVINLALDEKYEITIDRGSDLPLVTAQTFILEKPVLRDPAVGNGLVFVPKTHMLVINWNDVPNAGIYEVILRFNYLESDSTNHPFVPKSFEWSLDKNIEISESSVVGVDFYTTVKSKIKENIFASRRFVGIDIIILCGGLEITEFVKITKANSGITSTQDVPVYTNLSEGLGVFSSRNISENLGFQLNPQSLDSLKKGSITKVLKFQ